MALRDIQILLKAGQVVLGVSAVACALAPAREAVHRELHRIYGDDLGDPDKKIWELLTGEILSPDLSPEAQAAWSFITGTMFGYTTRVGNKNVAEVLVSMRVARARCLGALSQEECRDESHKSAVTGRHFVPIVDDMGLNNAFGSLWSHGLHYDSFRWNECDQDPYGGCSAIHTLLGGLPASQQLALAGKDNKDERLGAIYSEFATRSIESAVGAEKIIHTLNTPGMRVAMLNGTSVTQSAGAALLRWGNRYE